MFAHVSLTRDLRATRDMAPQEVWANLQPDPEIGAWEERRASLKQGRSRIQGLEAEAEIRQLIAKIRAKTARGEKEEEYADPEVDLAILERARLAGIWCNQPSDWSEEELAQRRVEAIDLMVALCDKRETIRRDRIRARRQIEPAIKQESPEPEPFPLLLNPNQCPDCVGDMRLLHEERTFEFLPSNSP
ncbi:hypothetical protein N0V84_012658 [Fusarium piperis]|uniref:Uncharacterized protein n=1 Tax=Fusarium piperis TaxID=1435070 RepID=A0A9W8W3F3_9HYPO|nr:hypothetical protein N0V84_012658 [Fusarium piperis]